MLESTIISRRALLLSPLFRRHTKNAERNTDIRAVRGIPTVYKSSVARHNGLYRAGLHRRNLSLYSPKVMSHVQGFTQESDFISYKLPGGFKLVENQKLFAILHERRPHDWMDIAKGYIAGGDAMQDFCAPEIGMLGFTRAEDPLNYVWREVICSSSAAYNPQTRQFENTITRSYPMHIADLLGHSANLGTHFADMPPHTLATLYQGVEVRNESPYFLDATGSEVNGRLPLITMTFDRSQLQ